MYNKNGRVIKANERLIKIMKREEEEVITGVSEQNFAW
jgi:hypothetical protein